jgi:phosphohistidine swiveling domain-containing protein
MNYIRWFSEIGANDVNLVGGKGANLGEMVQAGLPVPSGFCLTAEAYRAFMRATGLDQTIRGILADTDEDNPADIELKSAHIRQAIVEQDVPTDIAEQVYESYAHLAQESAVGAVDAPVAVRSSATAEDLPTASFAGQQESFLNVRGIERLLECIRDCWASLWTARAMTYRSRQDFDHKHVYLAVVVQAMINSEVSGILFTANPITGDSDEVVINASWGLGEAIVSGLVTPDTITVRKGDNGIISQQIATKERMTAYTPVGGTVERDTPAAQRDAPALSDDQVGELVALGRRIEAHYDAPQDIEWALFKKRFYILQSRPITTLKAQLTEVGEDIEYSRSMFVEIFPDPLSPSFLSVMAPIIHEMLDFTFASLGFKSPNDIDAVGTFYSQPYINRDYLTSSLAALSPKLREQMATQIMNPFRRHEQSLKGERSLAFAGMMARMVRFLLRFPKQLPDIIARYRAEVAQASALPLENMSDQEILTRIEDLAFNTASRLVGHDWLLIASTGVTYQALGALLEPYFGEETEEIRGKLISGVTGNVTMETNKAIWDLAQQAKALPTVVDVLQRYSDGDVEAQLEQSPEGRTFLGALNRFLAAYGHREVRMDILYPTWGEDPAPVLSFVHAYLDANESQSPHQHQARLAQEGQQLTEAVRKRLWQDRRGRFVIWPAFRWVLKNTRTHTRERDTMHFELTRLFPTLRRMLLELGDRWSEEGLIERPDDVFFLTWGQLCAAVESPDPIHLVVQANRAQYETNKRRPWPIVIRGDEEIYADSTHPDETLDQGQKGVAGSPGLVTGTARVIRGPEEFDRLQNGEILVAPLTNPVWTPLFAIAGGIVTEVGGILSHGAIVAREYGIPAVMGVAGVTRLVSEGQILTVDGNNGTVFLG